MQDLIIAIIVFAFIFTGAMFLAEWAYNSWTKDDNDNNYSDPTTIDTDIYDI